MKQRLGWVDQAKGIGIILVVFAHNLGGQATAGIPLPAVLKSLVFYAYSFHMPLFFFLAGLFAERSYRKGIKPFLASKVATVLYPFLLWSLIQGSVANALGGYVNHRVSLLHRLPYLLLDPIGQMWFLEALFVTFVVYAVSRRLGELLHFFLLSLVTLCASSFVSHLLLFKILYNMIFFAIGVWLHQPISEKLQDTKLGPLVLVGFGAMGLQIALLIALAPWESSPLPRALIAVLGISSIMLFSEALERHHGATWLKVVGQYSMPIFLMHTLFGSGARIIATHVFNLHQPWIHAGLELASGVALPMGVAYVLARLHAKWVFDWPQRGKVTEALV